MKTAIVYYSKHHGNTKKLLDEIAKEGDVTLIDAAEASDADLSGYELIGFASGIYFGKINEKVLEFAGKCLPENKKFFSYSPAALWERATLKR
ncbi:MAG: flavodoxin domain-containing protein [Oscillospiraceae bacterium]|nr:flavodoxin domain-containing protein [Oscillospiraceae bacterium]